MTSSSARRRKPLAIGLSVIVCVVVALVSIGEFSRERATVDGWMDRQAQVVEGVVDDAIDGVFRNLTAAAAFVEQTSPKSPEFAEFIDRIDGAANAVGIGYLTIVRSKEVEVYLEHQHESGPELHEIFGLNEDGSRKSIYDGNRTEFYPVEMFAVGKIVRPLLNGESTLEQLGLGLDIGYDPIWREDVAAAAAAPGPALSRFIDIKLAGLALDGVFFASIPVEGADGEIDGLVAAMMLEPLLLGDLDNRLLDEVQWELFAEGGLPERIDPSSSRVFALEMPGATWSLAIAPTDDALSDLRGQPWWLVATVAGVLAALAALSLWLLVDRRVEHSRLMRFKQVVDDKDRFLASVSHELRTPLTVVSGVANELRDRRKAFTEEEESSLLTMLVDQSDELAAIVEDLLIAARSDIGKVVIQYQQTDLGAEARRALEAAGTTATMRGEPGTAWADGQRVGQILRNLLTNAHRYGGPKVHIEFSANAGSVVAVVADNGPPIPEKTRDVMFEAYESAHKSDQVVRSVGLGLYISRNLARAMGGELDYAHDGAWSRFRLSLPEVNAARERVMAPPRRAVLQAEVVPIGQTSAVRFLE